MRKFIYTICSLCVVTALSSSVEAVSVGSSELIRDLSVEELNKTYIKRYQNSNKADSKAISSEKEVIEKQLEFIIGGEQFKYIIVPGDNMRVTFRDRNEINTAIYQVSRIGEIFLPLVGAIKIDGLDKKQAQERITKVLQKYIRDPDVELQVNMSGKVFIFGNVNSPGIYPLSPQLTAMEALFEAGFSNSAKLKKIVVMRGPVGNPSTKYIDLKKMLKKGDRTEDIYLKPGDLVYVPKTTRATIETFISQIYSKVLIWYGLGGQSIIEEGNEFIGPFGGELGD